MLLRCQSSSVPPPLPGRPEPSAARFPRRRERPRVPAALARSPRKNLGGPPFAGPGRHGPFRELTLSQPDTFIIKHTESLRSAGHPQHPGEPAARGRLAPSRIAGPPLPAGPEPADPACGCHLVAGTRRCACGDARGAWPSSLSGLHQPFVSSRGHSWAPAAGFLPEVPSEAPIIACGGP